MSPGMDAAWPWLPTLFGGRQIGALDAFHRRLGAGRLSSSCISSMVLLAGPINEVRSMITGWYRLPERRRAEHERDAALLTRRRLLGPARWRRRPAAVGCDRLSASPGFRSLLHGRRGAAPCASQRLIGGGRRWRGNIAGRDVAAYSAPTATPIRADRRLPPARGGGFADWTLAVDGLVRRPLALSLAALALPQRAQITRHDCVEGWSAIGKWQGPPLGAAARKWRGCCRQARYLVFHCADRSAAAPYYESIDLVDALPPADDPRLGDERAAAARRPTARRCACGSSASWATSTPSTSCASRRARAWRGLRRQGRLLSRRASRRPGAESGQAPTGRHRRQRRQNPDRRLLQGPGPDPVPRQDPPDRRQGGQQGRRHHR